MFFRGGFVVMPTCLLFIFQAGVRRDLDVLLFIFIGGCFIIIIPTTLQKPKSWWVMMWKLSDTCSRNAFHSLGMACQKNGRTTTSNCFRVR